MRRSMIQVYVHLVWATWDRLPLITPDIERRVNTAICDSIHGFGCPMYAIGGVPDHVHVLIGLSATASIATVVKEAKGSVSRLISHELRPNEFFKWQGAYGAFAVEHERGPTVIAYIRDQKRHHADQSEDDMLVAFLLTPEPTDTALS